MFVVVFVPVVPVLVGLARNMEMVFLASSGERGGRGGQSYKRTFSTKRDAEAFAAGAIRSAARPERSRDHLRRMGGDLAGQPRREATEHAGQGGRPSGCTCCRRSGSTRSQRETARCTAVRERLAQRYAPNTVRSYYALARSPRRSNRPRVPGDGLPGRGAGAAIRRVRGSPGRRHRLPSAHGNHPQDRRRDPRSGVIGEPKTRAGQRTVASSEPLMADSPSRCDGDP